MGANFRYLILPLNTMLIGATNEGMTLVLQYQVFGYVFDNASPESFKLVMTGTLTTATYADPNLNHLIKVGGDVRFQYDILKKGGREKAALTVSSC